MLPDRIGSRDITALVAERVVRETLTGVALARVASLNLKGSDPFKFAGHGRAARLARVAAQGRCAAVEPLDVLRLLGGAGLAAGRGRRGARGAPADSPAAGSRTRLRAADRVALYNPRTATAIVPASEAAAFGTALLPDDDAGLKAIVGTAVPEQRRGLRGAGRARGRRDLRRARRRDAQPRRPARGSCGSGCPKRAAAVVRGLPEPPRAPRAAGDGGPARAAVHRRPRRAPARVRAHRPARRLGSARGGRGAELVRRYLRGYGPSTPAHFAEWAGIGKAHARELWALATTGARRRPAAGRGRAAARDRRPAAARPRPRGAGAGPRDAQEGLGGGRRRRRRARGRRGRSRCGAPASRASGSRSRSRAGHRRRARCGPRPSGSPRTAAAARWRRHHSGE